MNLDKIKPLMEDAISHMEVEFTKVRTGRANPAMLDDVTVEAYGNQTPLNQVALISVPEARQLLVKPFDPSLLKEIEAGINKAELGINPTNDGQNIRINIPALTEETRKELTKETKSIAEQAKVAIRNIRKNANNDVKKTDDLTDDEKKNLENDIQNLTNEFNNKIDDLLDTKNKDIMTI